MIVRILSYLLSAIILPVIRTLIVDDHAFFRKILKEFLGAIHSVEVVGEAGSGEEALAAIERLNPQVIIMDVQMPGLDAISACAAVKRKSSAIRVILYSMNDPDLVGWQTGSRAYACLSKDQLFDDLPYIIGRVSQALGAA